MTVEEAIKFAQYAPQLSQEPEVRAFYRLCEQSLRAQRAAAKLDRSRWERCDNCTAGDGEFRYLLWKWGDGDFCSRCGRPLTEKAWADLERRINGGADDV